MHVIFLIVHDIISLPPVSQVLLELSPDTSVPVCPDVPLVFTCNATQLGVLQWFRNDTPFFSIDNNGGIILDAPPDGLQVDYSVQTGPTTADFISTLTVDNATLVGGSEICCGQTTSFANCTNVTLIGKAIYFRIEIVYLHIILCGFPVMHLIQNILLV